MKKTLQWVSCCCIYRRSKDRRDPRKMHQLFTFALGFTLLELRLGVVGSSSVPDPPPLHLSFALALPIAPLTSHPSGLARKHSLVNAPIYTKPTLPQSIAFHPLTSQYTLVPNALTLYRCPASAINNATITALQTLMSFLAARSTNASLMAKKA